ncbi:hypothetical protein, partial [Pseudomonas sp. BEA3.1]|uniref:hypothetical protein n=1 Tax=Pseudomonas sp. BEA3.1 TaxID=3083251 RepID=UPI002963FB11
NRQNPEMRRNPNEHFGDYASCFHLRLSIQIQRLLRAGPANAKQRCSGHTGPTRPFLNVAGQAIGRLKARSRRRAIGVGLDD